MPSETMYLKLTTYGVDETSEKFLDYRTYMGGTDPLTSNMFKIDAGFKTLEDRITDLQETPGVIQVISNSVEGTNYTATIEGFEYTEKQTIAFSGNISNAGNATLNINGLGIRTIKKIDESGDTVDLQQNDIKANVFYLLTNVGFAWIMIGESVSDNGNINIYNAAENLVTGDIVGLNNGGAWNKIINTESILYKNCPIGIVANDVNVGENVTVYIEGLHASPNLTDFQLDITVGTTIYATGTLSSNIFTPTGSITSNLGANSHYIQLGFLESNTQLRIKACGEIIGTDNNSNINTFNGNDINAVTLGGKNSEYYATQTNYEEVKELANIAQSTANTAQSTANTAQSTADDALDQIRRVSFTSFDWNNSSATLIKSLSITGINAATHTAIASLTYNSTNRTISAKGFIQTQITPNNLFVYFHAFPGNAFVESDGGKVTFSYIIVPLK